MKQLAFTISTLLIILFLSCSKEDGLTELYTNDFDSDLHLNEFVLNFGDITINNEEHISNSSGCLEIFGICPAPNLSKKIGPFDRNYKVKMAAWIKTEFGATLHLNIESNTQSYIRIETKEDITQAREWNLYESESIDLPHGESMMLYVDASNNTLSNTWVDELRIYGEEYQE